MCIWRVNVQAVCDSELQFVFVVTVAPSGTLDMLVCQNVSLIDLIDNLPPGFHIVGDVVSFKTTQATRQMV